MRWIVAAVLLLLSATSAPAQWSPYTCKLYFADSENTPPEVREVLKPGSDAALRVCSLIGDPETRYLEYVSAPLRGSFGVCQIVEARLYKHETGWFSHPPSGGTYYGDPSVLMMLANGDCPRQNDKRYTITNHASEGVFAAAANFWVKLSSGADQDALFAAVNPAVRSNSTFQEFESAVRSGAAFKLVSVSLRSATTHRMAHYHFDLEGVPKNFSVNFDFADERLVVLGIGEFMY